MSFAVRDFSVLAYAQGFTFWHYKAGNDGLAEVSADGFFDHAGDMLTVGDMLAVSSPKGCRMLCVLGAGPHVMTAPLS